MCVVWGLLDWGLHEASTAAALQESAAAMLVESGGRGSELTHRIARAGNFGRHKQNCARDINRALQLPLEALLNYDIRFPKLLCIFNFGVW